MNNTASRFISEVLTDLITLSGRKNSCHEIQKRELEFVSSLLAPVLGAPCSQHHLPTEGGTLTSVL